MQDFEKAAQVSFETEMSEVEQAAGVLDASDDFDAALAQVDEIVGSVLDVSSVRCIQVLLTTGGPARGYYIFVDSDGEPDHGFYWYQDWYQPKRIFWLSLSQLHDVVQAYDLYLGE